MTLAAVADSSIIIAVLTDEGGYGAAAAAALRGRSLHAPSLLPYEVTQVLRRLEAGARLSGAQAVGALQDLVAARIEFAPLEQLIDRVWALRRNVSAYDASYIALAERLGAPLITLDRRLARAPGIGCEVVVPGS